MWDKMTEGKDGMCFKWWRNLKVHNDLKAEVYEGSRARSLKGK